MVEELEAAQQIDEDLGRAKRELDEFESGVTRARMIERLRKSQPLHPVLWGARAGFGLFAALLASALGWTAVIALGMPVPSQLMHLLEASSSVPGPMILVALALCCLAFSAAMRELAAELGESRPMLDWESREYQKLKSEVLRLTAQRAVHERISATPAAVQRRSAYLSEAVA